MIHSTGNSEIVATIGDCRYSARVVEDKDTINIFTSGVRHEIFAPIIKVEGSEMDHGDSALLAPMPCKISHVSVKVGDVVKKGQTLIILEAMKMEVFTTNQACH
jgi:acetyl/propionyl-CoA carboxylase alpha subunit